MNALKSPEPLPNHIKDMWTQLMLGDPKASYFFARCGGVLPDSDEGKAADGPFAQVCPGGANGCFVANINHFGGLGGFDALLDRVAATDPVVPVGEACLYAHLLYICRFLYKVRACVRAACRVCVPRVVRVVCRACCVACVLCGVRVW